MQSELLIPYALGSDGRIVHVNGVTRGLACGCSCPACGQRLVAKKGTIKRHHFAHAVSVNSCESWLHDTAKRLLHQRIADAIAAGEHLPIKWQCQLCNCRHDGNLLKTATAVALESNLMGTDIRPDILLSSAAGQPCALIEIVVTHAPEFHTATYAEDKRLPMLEFHLAESGDLDTLLDTPLFPDLALMPGCPCRHCANCQRRECQTDITAHRWCNTCRDCFTASHRHCQRCQRVEETGNPHIRCDACGECYWDTSEWGTAHRHCRDCGDLMYPTSALKYRRCFCCYMTNLHKLPTCRRRGEDHSHCRQCGKSIKSAYENCYGCHRAQVDEANKEIQKEQEDQTDHEKRWSNADRAERESMLAEWRNRTATRKPALLPDSETLAWEEANRKDRNLSRRR